jgi:N-acetylglucosamine-6-phosphate deacetylase
MGNVIPGWVDLQVNGFAGVDFNAPDLTADAFAQAVRALAAAGTAAFCPTLITGDPETVCRNLAVILATERRDSDVRGRLLGFHLEGPFISSEPGAVGAHDPRWVRPPDPTLFDRLLDAAEGRVRLLTLAAELPGAADLTRHAVARGVTVSCGHQTAHTPEQLACLATAGASALTHLGNGVANCLPRHDNVIWAGLAEDRLAVMFIPDGHHLPRHLLKVYVRAAGVGRLIAVSDASHPAGLPPGRYQVLGNDAILEPDGLLHNPAKKCLVGSSITMQQALRVLADLDIGLTSDDLAQIGFWNPLRLIGHDPGSVRPCPTPRASLQLT